MNSEDMNTIVFMMVLLLMSAYFSATETAFSCLSRTRLKTMADRGDKTAEKVLKYANDYDRMLSTVLIGNNIVNILLSAVATVLFIHQYGEDLGPTIATAVITGVVLLFGEITPKSLAKEYPERFAKFSVHLLALLVYMLTPLNFLVGLWKKLLSMIITVQDDRRLTENDLLTIIEEAQQGGGIDAQESELIRNAIEFNDVEVGTIVTPRVSIKAISVDAGRDALEAMFIASGFSRLPIYEGTIDNIVGIVHLNELYQQREQEKQDIRDFMKPAVFITESMKTGDLLKFMQKKKVHMVVVADEFGGTVGIVTLEDILEELVGEIWNEYDDIVENFVQVNEKQYKIFCGADVDTLDDFFHINSENSDAVTVGGWVLEQFERIPVKGDSFRYGNMEIEVLQTDGKRVLEILVTVLDKEIEQDEINETLA